MKMRWCLVAILLLCCACGGGRSDSARAKNLLLVTVDTLRADRVGAYGYARARTPRLDELARTGVVFDRAYAAAPITLPSHATILSGRYPPWHGSRDNGMPVAATTPTLATELKARGFRTAAFVAAFPLDHQFGLARGFDVYGDRLPRDAAGRQANERPASQVIDEAIAWLRATSNESRDTSDERRATSNERRATTRFFLWIHLFEPHAPYGTDTSRPVAERYDDEVSTADREIGRLLDALGSSLQDTLIVAAGDHGEAFGEHGEYAHSIFIYDTTLRVPLILRGPGLSATRVSDAVTLADIAPTAMRMLGFEIKDVDGIDLSPAIAGSSSGGRELYAESFAPLVEFGWAPLRAIRSDSWKYIAAPKPELYNVASDAAEQTNALTSNGEIAQRLQGRINRYSSDSLAGGAQAPDAAAAERLRALGYVGAGGPSAARNAQSAMRPDPKDRRELAARIAQVTSGELSGAALLDALEGIVRDDPGNAQARLRLGYARLETGDCKRAEPEFERVIAAGLPTTDAYLGLAECMGRRGDIAGAERALNEAHRLEPDNAVIVANIATAKASRGDVAGAIEMFNAALAADPNFHAARFNLALTYARAGRRAEAAAAARDLLARLPREAPQRAEVERLIRAVTQ